MKKTLHTAFLAGLLSCASVFAQTIGVPEEMSYQATVTDDAGALLASTTPVSYEITMRIFEGAAGGLPLWSESHVTDIYQGRFSIVLGLGAAVPKAGGLEEPHGDLSTIFSGSERFTEITVRENTAGAMAKTLQPRQKLVATATAFRAKIAERLGTNANTALAVLDSGNVGVGTTSPGYPLQVAGEIAARPVDSSYGYISMGPGSVNSSGFIDWRNPGGARIASMGYATNEFLLKLESGRNFVVRGGETHLHGDVYSYGNLYSSRAHHIAGERFTHGQGAHIEWNKSGGGGKTYLLNQKGSGSGGIIFGEVTTADVITERMRIDSDGSIGIGISAPKVKLDVGGKIRAFDGSVGRPENGETGGIGQRLILWPGTSTKTPYGFGIDSGTMWSAVPGNARHKWYTDGNERMRITPGGSVMIGVDSDEDSQAKLVVDGGPTVGPPGSLIFGGYINQFGAGAKPHGAHTISIYADDTIWAGNTVIASSDERIKAVEGRSDGAADLEMLLNVEVTDYRYKDQIDQGNRPQKKLIAQQVERVFPQSVGQLTSVVPDIYEPAEIENGWVLLETDLKEGDRVKLIEETTAQIHEVLEVKEDKFRTNIAPVGEQVFVYGREVDDFRVVDYDAIAMLNVSATQEIYRRLEVKEKEVDALKSRLTAMDAKVAAIEKLLTASLASKKTSSGASTTTISK